MTTSDPGIARLPVLRLRQGTTETVEDRLAVEEPLELRLGYTDRQQGRMHRSVAITMRTPGDDAALGLGFLYGEGIIRSMDDIADIDASRANVLRIELHDEVTVERLRIERNFYTTSSCGMCGKASLEALSLAGYEAIADNRFALPLSTLQGLPDKLRRHQPLFSQTGGNHGVALFDANGEILLAREDVGRHNAMDKLIGTLLRDGRLPLREHGILLSGRASFELLQKALAAGCPLIAAVGAPSSLAVELAQEFDITLLGFLGERGCNVYHGGARILA